MKRSIIIITLIITTITGAHAQATNADVLHDLYRVSKRYEVGVDAGYGLAVTGLVLTPLGLSIMTTGFTLQNFDYAGKDNLALQHTITAGYTLAGIGIASLIIGIIVWRNQEKRYIDIINRQYRYRDFIQQKENN